MSSGRKKTFSQNEKKWKMHAYPSRDRELSKLGSVLEELKLHFSSQNL